MSGEAIQKKAVHEHRVVAFLLRLHFVPMREALKSAALEIVGKVQIQISRVKFLVDLLVDERGDFFIHIVFLRVYILYDDYTVGFRDCKVKNIRLTDCFRNERPSILF